MDYLSRISYDLNSENMSQRSWVSTMNLKYMDDVKSVMGEEGGGEEKERG